MTYKDMYEAEKEKWESKHPNRDYDEHIDSLLAQDSE